ncbi:hypothetical protein RB623_26100 [Mesorhizobium sp. LHD-90]|uniref:hypothetical protein n=1 Tax=Mesorhizobium sp. LHD-90 TaxID=3071414 RepID=UPI0027E193F9|nr:hypothetical protein [Mesorhizobium sp. LHD-90]MDQ6437542.1 hypothetical protein [Mesorhizobium sp. LHD-90]
MRWRFAPWAEEGGASKNNGLAALTGVQPRIFYGWDERSIPVSEAENPEKSGDSLLNSDPRTAAAAAFEPGIE